MKPTRADTEMQQIAELARTKAGITRSPLYRWLRARHDTFASLLEETRPAWRTLADGFARLGITTPDGTPIAPETVRHTWWRVRRDVAVAREKPAAGKPQTPAVTPITRPVPRPRPEQPTSGPSDALARLRAELNARSGRKTDG